MKDIKKLIKQMSTNQDNKYNPKVHMYIGRLFADKDPSDYKEHFYILKYLNITGDRFRKLYEEACLESDLILKETIDLFKEDIFTKEEIYNNLDNDNTIPFILINYFDYAFMYDERKEVMIRALYFHNKEQNKSKQKNKTR